ncbi:MAG: hypothetical protein AAF530_22070 [Pseudomonadota bacterium]
MSDRDDRLTDPIEEAKAIKNCLNYLENEARRVGLTAGADLIGAAGRAVDDAIALSERSVVFSEKMVAAKSESILPN